MARKNQAGAKPKDLYEERIKNEINLLLRKELADPRLILCSITRVELNPDYSVASVYWDTFDPSKRGDIKKSIEAISSSIRKHLSQNLNVRHTPILNFFYDSQYEDEMKITQLLNKAQSDDE